MPEGQGYDYESILDRSWDELPESKILPVGFWRLRGMNAVFQKPRSENQNPSILFVYSATEPSDDVDADALEELGEGYDWTQNRVYARFWIETAKDWDAVRKHLIKHGCDLTGRNVRDTLKNDFKGREIMSYLDVRSYEDSVGETVWDNDPKQFQSTDD